uniref:HAT C-terminal dimerisation domain-containing protein n=1 Tax=Chenopodium quinoa TaxID=63459 RepID=A0A803MN87_CHEQI
MEERYYDLPSNEERYNNGGAATYFNNGGAAIYGGRQKRRPDLSGVHPVAIMYLLCERSILDIYLEDPKLDRTVELDILAFWKKNEHRYKELSHLARDILVVPLTTVASESTLSIGSRILNKWKSSYNPENMEALITTRSWMFSDESK